MKNLLKRLKNIKVNKPEFFVDDPSVIKFGYIMLTFAFITTFSLFTNLVPFFRDFLLGTFGILVYVYISIIFIFARIFTKGKKYVLPFKETLYIFIIYVLVIMIFQAMFTAALFDNDLGTYITNIYNSPRAIGGTVIAFISFWFIRYLGLIGAIIAFLIIIVIFATLTADSIIKKTERKNKFSTKDIEENKKVSKTSTEAKKIRTAINKYFDNLNDEHKKIKAKEPQAETKKANILDQIEKDKDYAKKYFNRVLENSERTRKTNNSNNDDTQDNRKDNYSNDTDSLDHAEYKEDTNEQADDIKKDFEQKDNDTIKESRTRIFNDLENDDSANNKTLEGSRGRNIFKDIEKDTQESEAKDRTSKNDEDLTSFMDRTRRVDKPDSTSKPEPSSSEDKSDLKKNFKYTLPGIDLLEDSKIDPNYDFDIEKNKKRATLNDVFEEFDIGAHVVDVITGPSVTRFEIKMDKGVSAKSLSKYETDIAMALKSNGGIRIEYPIPGKAAVGIEVPNNKVSPVSLKEMLESNHFQTSNEKLPISIGKGITGNIIIRALSKAPHMLVAGTTGSGKSVFLNSLILSLLYKYSPQDLRLILVDPKRVEFNSYNNLPHLVIPEVITDVKKAINGLDWTIEEMEKRFETFQETNSKNITSYNNLDEVKSGEKDKMPYIIFIIDELADLMNIAKKDIEDRIVRLCNKSRAAGIHLVLATQRPSVNVITGTIKANLPERAAFSVASYHDSKTIIDLIGAEKLLGKGDMLYSATDSANLVRVQAPFVSEQEINRVIEFITENNKYYFDEEAKNFINSEESETIKEDNGDNKKSVDPLFIQALQVAIDAEEVSISMLQRRLAIGYPKAGRLVDQMADLNYIAPSSDGNKPRAVYITQQEFDRIYNIEDNDE